MVSSGMEVGRLGCCACSMRDERDGHHAGEIEGAVHCDCVLYSMQQRLCIVTGARGGF